MSATQWPAMAGIPRKRPSKRTLTGCRATACTACTWPSGTSAAPGATSQSLLPVIC
ncbi:unnamed protein product [Symbiodinium pilosum]|uniref:Uncharacterized protein n=1 Tax=Symbiodinium pilosum TaxID=2952 RepID=A0A812IMP5_SYMPI|nr:unnamed protein product [Symbiodinium pilosum]